MEGGRAGTARSQPQSGGKGGAPSKVKGMEKGAWYATMHFTLEQVPAVEDRQKILDA